MTTRIRFRAALAATVILPLLLTGCAATSAPGGDPVPVEPDGGTGTTDPYALSYPPLVDVDTAIPEWQQAADDLEAELAAWDAECTPADATYGTPCWRVLGEFLPRVNAVYQFWWGLDLSNFETDEYSGVVALRPAYEATLAARESAGAFADGCGLYDEAPDCAVVATAHHDDLTELVAAFSAWRGSAA